MDEIVKILLGGIPLFFGFFIGNFLRKVTKEEIKSGQKAFKLIIVLSFVGAFFSLIFRNDVLLFSFLFIIVVTTRSLEPKTSRH